MRKVILAADAVTMGSKGESWGDSTASSSDVPGLLRGSAAPTLNTEIPMPAFPN